MIYHPIIVVISLVIIFLLIVLIIIKELVRVSGHRNSRFWIEVLNYTIAPFFLTFLIIIFLRFITLMR